MSSIRVLLASDHAGFELKAALLASLARADTQPIDLGPSSAASTDYADHAHALALSLARGDAEFGVLVCGSGIGMAMAANRHEGIRAAVCNDLYSAQMARRHNDANIVCLGARVIATAMAELIVETFFRTPFEEGRHRPRVAKIERPDIM